MVNSIELIHKQNNKLEYFTTKNINIFFFNSRVLPIQTRAVKSPRKNSNDYAKLILFNQNHPRTLGKKYLV